MSEQKLSSQDILKIYQGMGIGEVPKDILPAIFNSFNENIAPSWKEILDNVKHKGTEIGYKFTYSNITSGGLRLTIDKFKEPTRMVLSDSEVIQIGEIEISDRRFYQVGFRFLENGQIVVTDNSETMKPIVLDTPESLVAPIPSSKMSPAGNALGAIEKILSSIDAAHTELKAMPDLR